MVKIEAERIPGSHCFGAVVKGVQDLSLITEEQHTDIQALLREHQFLVFRDQPSDLDPAKVSSFVHAFDPEASTVWRDQATNPWELYKAEHLGGAGTFQLPPPRGSTLVLGKGEVKDHWGLNATLGGARAAYGKTSGSQVIGGGFLQWHIDGAFWKAPTDATGWPCRVVGMRCVTAPGNGDTTHTINMGDGASLTCPLGATAFVSGQTAWNLLTPEERHRALRTTVVYAHHPFKRFAKCGMTKDGLQCVGGADKETPVEGAEMGTALRMPLVWTHPETGKQALMINTRCFAHLELSRECLEHINGNAADVEVIPLPEARIWLHTIMRRAVEPSLIYAHGWKSGDFAIWDNLAVWHSATGGLRSTDHRVMHLHAFDGSKPPLCRVLPERRRLVCLVIGQTPRPDLLAPLVAHMKLLESLEATEVAEPDIKRRRREMAAPTISQRFFKISRDGSPQEVEVLQVGALDGLEIARIESLAPATCDHGCPLITRLRDDRHVIIDEDKLEPLMQARVSSLDGSGCNADAVILLCAGAFSNLHSCTAIPLFRPFDCTANVVESLGVSAAMLLVPTEKQGSHSLKRWKARLPQVAFAVTTLPPNPDASEIKLAAVETHRWPREADVVILDFVGHAPQVVDSVRKEFCPRLVIDVGEVALKQVAAVLF